MVNSPGEGRENSEGGEGSGLGGGSGTSSTSSTGNGSYPTSSQHPPSVTSSFVSSMSASPAAAASSALLRFGCGQAGPLTLDVTTTTGGNFSIDINSEQTVEHLKKMISKKLKVSKDRICLLHRERELHDGTLRENGLVDGSKLILTPNVETGLLAQRAENTVMQALESLNDNQVNDFLSGKSPLNLSVRLGDHMMLIQLQLSTLNPLTSQGHTQPLMGGSSSTAIAAGRARSASSTVSSGSSSSTSSSPSQHLLHHHHSHHPHHPHHHHHHHHQHHQKTSTTICSNVGSVSKPATLASSTDEDALCSQLTAPSCTGGRNVRKSVAEEEAGKGQPPPKRQAISVQQEETTQLTLAARSSTAVSNNVGGRPNHTVPNESSSSVPPESEAMVQSPIKSLSNLVSSRTMPIDGEMGNGTTAYGSEMLVAPGMEGSCTDPITANLTSCLCRRLSNGGGGGSSDANVASMPCSPEQLPVKEQQQLQAVEEVELAKTTSSETSERPAVEQLHRTAHNPIAKHKAKLQSLRKASLPHYKTHVPHTSAATGEGSQRIPSLSSPVGSPTQSSSNKRSIVMVPQPQPSLSTAPTAASARIQPSTVFTTPSLVEAVRRSLFSLNGTGHQRTSLSHRSEDYKHEAAVSSGQPGTGALENSDLAEASRNLTQTLRKLSKRVFTGKAFSRANSSSSNASSAMASSSSAELVSSGCESSANGAAGTASSSSESMAETSSSCSSATSSSPLNANPPFGGAGAVPLARGPGHVSSGAVIESMKHHGKGIYSGTFSGTLNPALQDKYGRPKRDISTIIHILNDLLSAAPQCAATCVAPANNSVSNSTESSVSRGTKFYFDPTGKGNGKGGSVSFGAGASSASSSSGGSSGKSSSSSGGRNSNRNTSSSTTSWFVPAPPSVHRQSTKNVAPFGQRKYTVVNGSVVEGNKSSSSMSGCTGCSKASDGVRLRNNGLVAFSNRTAAAGSTSGSGSLFIRRTGSPSKLVSVGNGSLLAGSVATSSIGVGTSSPAQCQCIGTAQQGDGLIQPKQQCRHCKFKAIELEHSQMKVKLDNLRLIMQQKKERREARKQLAAPYGVTGSFCNTGTPHSGNQMMNVTKEKQCAGLTSTCTTESVPVDVQPPLTVTNNSSLVEEAQLTVKSLQTAPCGTIQALAGSESILSVHSEASGLTVECNSSSDNEAGNKSATGLSSDSTSSSLSSVNTSSDPSESEPGRITDKPSSSGSSSASSASSSSTSPAEQSQGGGTAAHLVEEVDTVA
ncbi:midnolin homolog [Anopheles albimanus]|uniref:Ubiquitin-like domain-containing protein n=1 Tax=Anopheles albimanus TaxID=7167 RepID=A0A182FIC5_ANOAL|nr:midnolin homolog [Anopheles albimanus]XP_035772574.1 midnolin homolog [Anopheles albimanus]XP_035772582.1 midnolin homolog [Anopheles albimanus]XP_035772592.1 midnolin homolog [Anopheles albimanus]XP_035772603.1 midnolin homolog [Anopheles albimanus]XP_035772611.1 midnolin homolog [Anopheles albimanus]XP_035772619.1 midnolin homolog [Anopheles albimanus]